jgi:survival of motor neuron protein-interacting protein 1
MPSIEWQREQVSDFTRVRLKMSQMKEYRIKMGLRAEPSEGRTRSMWWWKEYCIGKKSSDEESSSGSEQSTLTDTPNSNDSSLKNDKQIKPKANLPLLSFLCDMSSEEVILNLSYHIKWIRQFGFTHQNAIWIYALLVNLEKPLPSEVYSTLRELSRVCSEVRAKIGSISESTILVPLNLIICLIGRYFDQNDMIDE